MYPLDCLSGVWMGGLKPPSFGQNVCRASSHGQSTHLALFEFDLSR